MWIHKQLQKFIFLAILIQQITTTPEREGQVSGAVFGILGPPPISGTGEARNLKFGMWLWYALLWYKLANDKLPPQCLARVMG